MSLKDLQSAYELQWHIDISYIGLLSGTVPYVLYYVDD